MCTVNRPDECLISLKDTMFPLHEKTHKKIQSCCVWDCEPVHSVCVFFMSVYIYEKDGETDNPCHFAGK